jgi:hypothetical protein
MDPFPEEIRRFIEFNVESIDQLEILRLLRETPNKEWEVPALAAEVQAPEKVVASHLVALHGRGLLFAEKRNDWIGRYGPHTPEHAQQVELLLKCYEERPVSMIKLVNSLAKSPLQAFAEAFQIRKEGK